MSDTARPSGLPQTAEAVLRWPGDGRARRYQLVDGEVRAMSPASATHGLIQAALSSIIRPDMVGPDETLRLESIGLVCPVNDLYADTHLRRG